MSQDGHADLVDQMRAAADRVVRVLVTQPRGLEAADRPIERLRSLQDRCCREFPSLPDEVDFWETLWLRTDAVRDQWNRIEGAARGAGAPAGLQALLDESRRTLYDWARRCICERAPRVPSRAHFELGVDTLRPDRRGLHERIEGLYESIKRIGALPGICESLAPPTDRAAFAVIYGGGWNVSTFSVLREASNFESMNALVAFDHPGANLYGKAGGHVLRLAPAGLMRAGGDRDEYVLARFAEPLVLHFVCPHEWTGPPPHELRLPVLRSDLTLEIVADKINTSRALQWYAGRTGADLPLIRQEAVQHARAPCDADALSSQALAALSRLEGQGVSGVVAKPVRGEQGREIGFFELPGERDAAARHCVRLALESGALIQERIRPPGGVEFNWRVLVALRPDGEPCVVGRFARAGRVEEVEMVPDREMLSRCGICGADAEALLSRLDRVSLDAFRAVAGYAAARHPQFPRQPLGGGRYHTPYFLGIDLIGDARIMEVNGNEVAGMWTDDRLYPETRGRSSRTVLESAEIAARAYRAAVEKAR